MGPVWRKIARIQVFLGLDFPYRSRIEDTETCRSDKTRILAYFAQGSFFYRRNILSNLDEEGLWFLRSILPETIVSKNMSGYKRYTNNFSKANRRDKLSHQICVTSYKKLVNTHERSIFDKLYRNSALRDQFQTKYLDSYY